MGRRRNRRSDRTSKSVARTHNGHLQLTEFNHAVHDRSTDTAMFMTYQEAEIETISGERHRIGFLQIWIARLRRGHYVEQPALEYNIPRNQSTAPNREVSDQEAGAFFVIILAVVFVIGMYVYNAIFPSR